MMAAKMEGTGTDLGQLEVFKVSVYGGLRHHISNAFPPLPFTSFLVPVVFTHVLVVLSGVDEASIWFI
jgi:hypothetical protein